MRHAFEILRPLAALCLALALCFPAAARADGRDEAEDAAAHGFQRLLFSTEQFTLFGLLRSGKGDALRVYMEGDGRAWLTRTRPSSDPTPQSPVALRLALADPSEDSILYLARPCQFVESTGRRNCERRWWTNARLAREVIDSLDSAVTQAKTRAKATRVALIGYSGGGGAAVLTAARRRDVVYIATLAGNLHAAAWTTHHHVSPLAGSLEPFDSAAAVRGIPQWHVSGGKDSIMPPFISYEFCAAVGPAAQCLTLPDMKHDGAWEQAWRAPVHLPELYNGGEQMSSAQTMHSGEQTASTQALRLRGTEHNASAPSRQSAPARQAASAQAGHAPQTASRAPQPPLALTPPASAGGKALDSTPAALPMTPAGGAHPTAQQTSTGKNSSPTGHARQAAPLSSPASSGQNAAQPLFDFR